jgi:hypothetical protein
MDNSPFLVSPYPLRPSSPWKLEIRAKFAGKKIRRFFATESEAWAEGDRLTGQIRERGRASVASGGLTVSKALARFWSVRGPSIKGRHRRIAKYIFDDFATRYGSISLDSIGAAELHAFWNRSKWPEGKSARWQAFTYLRIFFNWAERWDLIGRNPCRKVDTPAKPKPLRGIVTPEQMQDLLTLSGHHLAFVCLGGFAGLRTSEIFRLNPAKDLDWQQKEIFVNDAGKTGGRYVQMLPAFVRHCPKEFTFPNERNFYSGFRNAIAAFVWQPLPQNALRHSWHTYHLAKFKDAAKTAMEGGNSEKMVREVYALPAKRANQAAYWRL